MSAEPLRVIELFAGIGGLALALPAGCRLVAAHDQSDAARATHARNHGVPVHGQDLATVEAAALESHAADAWLLSPPCQPFTRRGRRRDVDDPRCRGLLRLIDLLPLLRPRRVLVENVEGFHGSRAHDRLVSALRGLGHEVADLRACPSDEGWPVRRPRQFTVSSADGLRSAPAHADVEPRPLASFLDATPDDALLLPAAWRARVEPVGDPDVPLSTFTRSYGQAMVGAGPILPSPNGPRFFSPGEILRLHGFPATTRFPDDMPLRTRWRLAGNAVHVASARRALALWPEAGAGELKGRA